MIKYFKEFFYPTQLVYLYNLPNDKLTNTIEQILKKKATLFTSNDMTGKFISEDTFLISLIPFSYTQGIKYSSTLIGKIQEINSSVTEIRVKTRPSYVFYAIFFVITLFGFAYLYKFIETNITSYLFLALFMIILGPLC